VAIDGRRPSTVASDNSGDDNRGDNNRGGDSSDEIHCFPTLDRICWQRL